MKGLEKIGREFENVSVNLVTSMTKSTSCHDKHTMMKLSKKLVQTISISIQFRLHLYSFLRCL